MNDAAPGPVGDVVAQDSGSSEASQLLDALGLDDETTEPDIRQPVPAEDKAWIPPARIAGIIRTPGIDDALETIESEQDIVRENVNLLEGAQQSRAELERWNALYRETLTQCNRRLMPHGVCLGACAPNPAGLGAVFVGIDHEKRDYTVTLTLPARERNDFANASKEDFVRWAIDAVCGEVLAQRERYLRRMGVSGVIGPKGARV